MENQEIKITEDSILNELARRRLKDFTQRTDSTIQFEDFHEVYYEILDRFAHGKLKNVMITIPSQHGKSEGSSRKLPAFMLGLDPNKKIAIGSYSGTFAQDFNKDVQKIIDTPTYSHIFPETKLFGQSSYTRKGASYLRNSTVFEIPNYKGTLRAVGRGGPLTGKPVDVMIMDDLYKDGAEAKSPILRKGVVTWYTSVVRKRLHNDSQQLMVFTRWDGNDLIGYIEEHETVITVTCWADLENIPEGAWVKINFEALKDSKKTEFDSREIGEALWDERHNKAKHEADRKLDPFEFECMSQGNPSSKEGRLYTPFKTYSRTPVNVLKKGNYTDTADTGNDYLCSICYDVCSDGYVYVTDVTYTQDKMELTEPQTSMMLDRNNTRISRVESNNGGRGFARAIEKIVKICRIDWFHQGGNKESRIITNAPTVNKWIVFPVDWVTRWPVFATHVMTYKRLFKANEQDDAPDTLTGIIETEKSEKKVKSRWDND